jgi:hypothetical protein
MLMKLRSGLASITTAAAMLALPGAAAAEYVVPPGNSAATQYTEAFPTAGGNKGTHRHVGRRPAQVLGQSKARRLDARGPAGEAVAALAAETAPAAIAPASRKGGGDSVQGGESGRSAVASPSGSSGLGEVLAQATGSSSSGDLGLLLPLLILAAIAWAVAYWARHRGRPTA